ncbi:hypothetical protein OJ996_07265 [Luteolibacter sp. GHJ8]|uniref:Immunity protein 53 of polymorphic toxin system n=1 Tax=Luteolibacter rhizosphaerae TaxID=2989719 RepID=A0ABT3G0K8_9BACT|nr:hypothetical protein [Luteolibacter rhizosphaerae]MCW1913365.1 hypothetical protein [Luteolibacter rhizosphaerae]
MNIDASSPIVWTGDLEDDCTAFWGGLILRAEEMNDRDWWWAVSRADSGLEIASSNDDGRDCTSGPEARAFAEQAARAFIRQ